MINFEEELKKFQPIPEVKEAEAAIYERDLTDMVDIIRQMTEQQSAAAMTAEPKKAHNSRRMR